MAGILEQFDEEEEKGRMQFADQPALSMDGVLSRSTRGPTIGEEQVRHRDLLAQLGQDEESEFQRAGAPKTRVEGFFKRNAPMMMFPLAILGGPVGVAAAMALGTGSSRYRQEREERQNAVLRRFERERQRLGPEPSIQSLLPGQPGQPVQAMTPSGQVMPTEAVTPQLTPQQQRAAEIGAATQEQNLELIKAQVAKERREAPDNFSAIAEPATGRIVIYDKKTGKPTAIMNPGDRQPTMLDGGSRPGASAATGPEKFNESQRTGAARAGEGIIGLENALAIGLPEPGVVGGAWQALQMRMARAGYPELAGERAEQLEAFWTTVADPIMRARTGAGLPTAELEGQLAQLVPRPGESINTQIRKVNQMVDLFKNQTVGLPEETKQALLQQLDALAAQVPKNPTEYNELQQKFKKSLSQREQDQRASAGRPAPGSTVRVNY